MNDELEAELPAESLVLGGGAPVYEREYREPAFMQQVRSFDPASVPVAANLRDVAEKLIALPNIASKRWVYQQYDSMVGTANSSTNAPSDAPVVWVKGTKKGLAMTADCNSRYVYADPQKGCMIAVSEAARNIVCSGGEPLGVTNCLNFGNPYDPEVYYQFVHAIRGMGEACLKFNTPVTGGNVSFYNQNPDGAVYPTPTIGMVGLLEDMDRRMTLDFKASGDLVYLLGEIVDDIASSEYLHKICSVEFSPAPHFELDKEFGLQKAVLQLIRDKTIHSAHDLSEGGLFVALFESAAIRDLGFDAFQTGDIRADAFWFGEAQSRVLVSVSPDKATALEQAMVQAGIPCQRIGTVTPDEIRINGQSWGHIESWKERYDNSIGNHMNSYHTE
jgi:phosphoribosylformylglycinamidine synthase subunit PurL